MYRLIRVIGLVVVGMVLFSMEALAVPQFAHIKDGTSDDKIFVNAEGLVDNSVKRTSYISFGIGGLGAIGLGALAFFGRFNWGWMMALIGGLLVITASQLGIGYITGVNNIYNPNMGTL